MAENEYEEITLGDLVDTLLKRKAIVLVVLVAAVAVGAAAASTEPVTHVAEASFVPLGSTTIVTSYLDSRQAAKDILDQDPAIQELLDPGGRLGRAELVEEIRDMTRITWSDPIANEEARAPNQVLVTVRAEGGTEEAAVAVAQAYLAVLPTIRPVLQELYETERFSFYFASTEHLPLNVTQARELARQDAQEQQFWLVFDEEADVEQEGGTSNLRLNLALGAVLGIMLGVFAAFTAEWWAHYRAQRRPA